MFSMECAQLEVPRREGGKDEEYEMRSETLLNSVITDLAIDLRYVVLAHPTKKLKALLGYTHLADIKILLSGSRYRNHKDGTTGSVINARQEVSPDYEKKAAKLDRGGSTPGREVAGSVTMAQCRDIAEQKLKDLNTTDLDEAQKMIAGSARSMGLEVHD